VSKRGGESSKSTTIKKGGEGQHIMYKVSLYSFTTKLLPQGEVKEKLETHLLTQPD
jgi:hypothetical protein